MSRRRRAGSGAHLTGRAKLNGCIGNVMVRYADFRLFLPNQLDATKVHR